VPDVVITGSKDFNCHPNVFRDMLLLYTAGGRLFGTIEPIES